MGRKHHPLVPRPSRELSLFSPSTQSQKSLLAKVVVPPMVEKPTAGDDFYRACNETWLLKTPLPRYRVSYSVSEEIEDYLEEPLYAIARQATLRAAQGKEAKTAEDAAEDAIGRLVMSAIRPEKQGANLAHLKQSMRNLACLRTQEDVAITLGQLIRFGIPTVLTVGVDVAYDRGRRHHILVLEPGSLGLPDANYYIQKKGGIQRPEILREYRELLEFITREIDPGFTLADGISTEAELAEPLAKFVESTEIQLVQFTEVRQKFSAIPWDALFKGLGCSIPRGRIGIVAMPWLSVVNSMMKSLPIDHWRRLFGIHTAIHGIAYLPAPFDDRHFQLFGRRLQAQVSKTPQHVLTMSVLKTLMSEYMSYFFVKRYLDSAERVRATQFVDSLIAAAKRRIQANDWMEEATRKAIITKLSATSRSVFYEITRPPSPIPALQTDIFLANIYLLAAATFDADIARLDRPVAHTEHTGEPAFTVNAFYYQELNQLVLPAGNFVWPFYSAKRLGWSYGGIGATIAHELVHAFDEEGKMIDARGESRPLWSARDERQYTTRLQQLIQRFNQAKVGTTPVNGLRTASENLADLGGVAIALDALEAQLHGKVNRLEELRDFFWSYAVSWRTKIRETKAIQQIFMDRHAPPKYRVNYIVSQFDQWYEAFGVKTGDDLYIPPEERIRII